MTNSKRRRLAAAAVRAAGPSGRPDVRGSRHARRHPQPIGPDRTGPDAIGLATDEDADFRDADRRARNYDDGLIDDSDR